MGDQKWKRYLRGTTREGREGKDIAPAIRRDRSTKNGQEKDAKGLFTHCSLEKG